MLRMFDAEMTDKLPNTHVKIFDVFRTLCINIQEYLQLVIPTIVKTCERLYFGSNRFRRSMEFFVRSAFLTTHI